MSKTLGIVALALAAAAPLAQAQDTGNWLVRGRALYLDSANKDKTAVPDVTGSSLSVNNKWFPEVDITYFFTPNLAAELVLTYPQKHDVRLGGSKIGTVKHLPPTLSAQYHFTNFSGFRPYVGVGLNLTLFSDVDILDGKGSLDTKSTGLAFGAGVDIPLGDGWLLNFDVKKVNIRTDVGLDPSLLEAGSTRQSPLGLSTGHVNVGEFRIDPMLYSIGIGKRF